MAVYHPLIFITTLSWGRRSEQCRPIFFRICDGGKGLKGGSATVFLCFGTSGLRGVIARSGHLPQRDAGMARFHLVRQTARCFGDDLKTSRHRVDSPEIILESPRCEAAREACRKVDVMENIAKRGLC